VVRALTPELTQEIAAYVAAGMPLARAAVLAGISRSTAKRWMALGESSKPGDAMYASFREAIERARAKSELKLLMQIRSAADDGDWKAAAWLLRNASPDAYDDAATIEHEKPSASGEPVRLYAVKRMP
jgi:hypothetical protein